MKIDYDELRKLAEVALAEPNDGCEEWYDVQGLENSLFARIQPIDAPFINAMSPRVALRLLEIIEVAKEGLACEICSDEACHHDECVWARAVLNAIAKLERGE